MVSSEIWFCLSRADGDPALRMLFGGGPIPGCYQISIRCEA